ncbi:hypothetical protein KAZ93_00830 [Patescibacteria group bacterium]|nr:hypothetical protein [Patescibacteria group bacterium]
MKSIPEKSSQVLVNTSVFNTINYFIDHTEECTTEIRESEEIEESPLPEDLRLGAYGTQIVWELSISYKKQYFEALLESLSTRKSQKYEDKDIDICFSEALYLILDRINSL